MLKLLNAYSAEQQAIAIYKSQSFWRPGSSGNVFREVLADERSHQQSIDQYISQRWIFAALTPFNHIAGWIVGTALSMLPRGLCYRIHVWAEMEAAATYEAALRRANGSSDGELRQALSHAAGQERDHARRFESMLRNRYLD